MGFEVWYSSIGRIGPDLERPENVRLKVSFVFAAMKRVRTFDPQHVGRMRHVQACAARVLDSIALLSIERFPQGFVHVVLGCSVRVCPIRVVELFDQLGRAEEGMPAPIACVVGAQANVVVGAIKAVCYQLSTLVTSDSRVGVSVGLVRDREILWQVSDADCFLPSLA